MKKLNNCLTIFICLLLSNHPSSAQSFVSITIDDVPNTEKYLADKFETKLLNKLDSLQIPVTIFINKGLVYKTDSISKNLELLDNWIKREYVIPGNHTFSHLRYSDTDPDSFKRDIEKGEYITGELSQKYNKPLCYFRFPYNDLGIDSMQHSEIEKYLISKNYQVAPFTIESSDWMYNYIYEYYLKENDLKHAEEIGRKYVAATIAYFDFFDSLATKICGRKVRQIYLCHDNSINADYLPTLINELKNRHYSFTSIEEALKDDIYRQKDHYYKKWGISWFYRWMKNPDERKACMKSEPDMGEIEKLYGRLIEEGN